MLLLLSRHGLYRHQAIASGCAIVDKCRDCDIQRCLDNSVAMSVTTCMHQLLKSHQLPAESSQDHIHTCRQEGRQAGKQASMPK